MAPFTVECQLEPRGDKWNPFGTPDSNSVAFMRGGLSFTSAISRHVDDTALLPRRHRSS